MQSASCFSFSNHRGDTNATEKSGNLIINLYRFYRVHENVNIYGTVQFEKTKERNSTYTVAILRYEAIHNRSLKIQRRITKIFSIATQRTVLTRANFEGQKLDKNCTVHTPQLRTAAVP
ncbi:uncharacterized protein LOC143151761 [Ptiloglossa arizonensis]|uniref:uncharacterized protein LOC143151761 n=1 Tax=Ptiloglossa arizonensis TaxID=3350558 RepID=UPI003F9EEA62